MEKVFLMRPPKELQIRFVSWFLSLLIICISLLGLPQPAFAANEYVALLESRYLEDFLCVKAQSFPAINFINSSKSGYLKDQNIKSLSNKLTSCVSSNRLTDVDLGRLINVYSTSQINKEEDLIGIVVAAGRKPRTPLSISTGRTENNVKVEIVNFEEIDGAVVKVGTPIKIEAKARGGGGENLSNYLE